MPALSNPRHERFAQLLHKSGIKRHAYIGAGYKARKPRYARDSSPVDRCATRLSKDVRIAQRLEELAAMSEKRHQITVDTLLTQLKEDRQLAHTARQSGGAVAATMSQARLLGLVVDRKESGGPGEFANMQSIQEVIAVVRRELGDQAADALGGLLQADAVPEPTHEAGGAVN